jgi:amino acid adenylation domain-containing protein
MKQSLPTLLCEVLQRASRTCNGITFLTATGNERKLSYAELLDQAGYVLHNLKKHGVKDGDEIVFQASENESFLLIFWACILGGIIPVPLAIGNQDEQKIKVFRVIKTLHNPTFVSDDSILDRLVKDAEGSDYEALARSVNRSSIKINDLLVRQEHGKYVTVSPSDLAYIQFSSGSTSEPKGVMLTHKSLLSNIDAIVSASKISDEDRSLSWMPLSHDMGLICFHLASMHAGIDQYIIPTQMFIRNPVLWIDKSYMHRVTMLYSPNFGLHYFLNSLDRKTERPIWDLSSLRLIYNGAEPISPEVCLRFTNTLKEFNLSPSCMNPGYGLAEACVAVTLPIPGKGIGVYSLGRNQLEIGQEVREDAAHGIKFVGVGRPVNDCQVRITDNDNNILPDKHIGNIQISGTNVTKGYYNNATENARLFSRDGWLNTGDIGFFSGQELIVTGRSKSLIIINGQNYYPHDIERCLHFLPELDFGKVVACGVRSIETSTEQLVVFILYKKPFNSFISIVNSVRANVFLHTGLTVTHVVPVRKIPKTTSGKVQHHQLVNEYLAGTHNAAIQEIDELLKQEHSYPASDLQLLDVLKINLQSLIGKISVADDDELYSLGINSLIVMQWVNRINSELNLTLTASDILKYNTLAGLANYIQLHYSEKSRVLPDLLPVPLQSSYEVSFGQKNLWFLQQLNPDSPFLNLSTTTVIEAYVDKSILQGAFDLLIQKYEILRTVFVENSDDLKQVLAHSSFELDSCILNNELDWEEQMRLLAVREAQRSFDLGTGPLMRGLLVQINSTRFAFVFVIHHILCDGWSFGILTKEVKRFFGELLCKGNSIEKGSGLQFKDFVSYQNLLLRTGQRQHHEKYWLNIVSRGIGRLDLPAINSRPSIRSFNGGQVVIDVPEQLTDWVDRFSKKQQSTAFHTWFTLLNVFFHRLTGKKDIVLGTVAAGRDSKASEQQIGYFLNTFPVLSTVHDDESFSDLQRNVRDNLLDAFEHQYYPYDLILKTLGIKKDITHALFDVLVLYQDFEHPFHFDGVIKDARHYQLDVPVNTCLTDLEFEFLRNHDYLKLNIRYNTDLFTASQICEWWNWFTNIASQLVQNPEIKISDLSLLSDSEAAQIILQLSSNEEKYTGSHIVHNFENSVSSHTSNIALRSGETWTYSTLNAKANQLAHYLINNYKVNRDTRIGVMIKSSTVLIQTLLGTLKAGVTYVPIDHEYPVHRVNYMIADAGIGLLITTSDLASRDYQAEAILEIDKFEQILNLQSESNLQSNIKGDDIAYILYTSGSTGQPKGVMIRHHSLAAYASHFSKYFNVTPRDKVIQQSSIAFDVSVEEIYPVLCCGGELLLVEDRGRNVNELLELIESGATILSTTPSVIDTLNRFPLKLTKLKALISGGETLRPGQINQLVGKVPLFNTYGPTESTVCATYHPMQSLSDIRIIGRPVSGRQVYVLDPYLKVSPIGVTGEIYIGGEGIAAGYVNRPEAESQSFIQSPFDNQVIYKTGDRGRWLKDGTLEFIGRVDYQIKIRGYRIEPGEIEKRLLELPSVTDALVQAIETTNSEDQLAAYLIAEPSINIETVRQYLFDCLPFYMVPSHFVVMSEFPLSISGKVNRSELPKPDLRKEASTFRESAVTSTEKVVEKIWGQILIDSQIYLNGNFFALGGDSLKGTRIISLIFKSTGIKLSLNELFRHPTISRLASYLDGKTVHGYSPIKPVTPADLYPVSHAQKRLWLLCNMNKNLKAYNLVFAQILKGPVDIDAFLKTVQYLFDRHESLRSNFTEDNGQLYQRVNPFDPSMHTGKILRASESYFENIVIQEGLQSFDFAGQPLAKFNLFQSSDQVFLLTISIHHIIADGWSVDILQKEFYQLYKSFVNSEKITYNPPAVQYKDYASWHSTQLLKDGSRADQEYWLSQFKDEIPNFYLSSQRLRSAARQFKGKVVPISLTDQVPGIKQLKDAHNTTWAAILLSLVKTTLFRYTGQSDIVIGVPFSGRIHPDLHDVFGFFVNTLPVRTFIDEGQNFSTLLDKVNAKLLEADKHQGFPFDFIVEALNTKTTAGYSPFYNIVFSFVAIEDDAERDYTDGLQVEQLKIHNGTSKYDLVIHFELFKEQLEGVIEYDSDLYEEDSMKTLALHMREIMLCIIADPSCRLGKLKYLLQSEIEYLQEIAKSKISPHLSELSLLELFNSQVLKQPSALLMIDRDNTYTYEMTNKESEILADLLKNIEE